MERLADVRPLKPSLWQKLSLLFRGYCFLRWEKKPNWKAPLPIYLVKCPDCNRLFEDYPHGHSKYFLCPRCREASRR